MPSPIAQAIELFQLNLRALDLWQERLDIDKALYEDGGWAYQVLFFPACIGRRQYRLAVARLGVLRAAYRRAEFELGQGRTDFALIQLRDMAGQLLDPPFRPSFWDALTQNRAAYHLSPYVPGIGGYGPAQRVKAFAAIAQLIGELDTTPSP